MPERARRTIRRPPKFGDFEVEYAGNKEDATESVETNTELGEMQDS